MTAPATPVALRESTALHIVGLALQFTATGMAVSALVDLLMGGDAELALLAAAVVTGATGLVARRFTSIPATIRPGAVFAAVTWSWIAMSVAGTLPFLFGGVFDRFDDALFESISGFTCTGSTLFTTEMFDTTSAGIMWWRQLTHWFGGMGIIVLAVAVLPFIGVGGLELISAEAPGPESDRLAPRVSETARTLWRFYLWFTVASTGAFMVVGLSLYDASAHALALVSTGGFSTNAESIGAYDSVSVELVAIIGMVIGGASFTLHHQFLRGRLGVHWRNAEFRLYIGGMLTAIAAVTVLLAVDDNAVGAALRNAAFNVVTLATSCGFGNAQGADSLGNFVLWAPAAQVVLFSFMWSGGMTGSTSGGIKTLRIQVMGRLAWRELLRARSIRSVRPIKQGATVVGDDTVSRIAGFVLLYFVLAVASAVAIALLGNDPITSFSGTVGSLGNMGPALGEAGPASNFEVFPRPSRMILAALMLVGRLEVFPVVLVVVMAVRRAARSRLLPASRV